ADADAGPVLVAEDAVGDGYVLGRAGDDIALHAAAGLQRDTIVHRVEVAAFDDDATTGIHVDAVGAAMHGDAPEHHVLAIDRVDRPHVVLLGEDVGDAEAAHLDEFEQAWVTQAGRFLDAALDRLGGQDLALSG